MLSRPADMTRCQSSPSTAKQDLRDRLVIGRCIEALLVGQHGSIALIERFIRTVKDEATRRILVPQRGSTFRRELDYFFAWYNACRPHTALEGRTPNEGYFRLRSANRRPRIEPRRRWPRRSPCAGPRTLIAGQPGDRFTLEVDFHGGAIHLPIVSLKRSA